MPSLAIIVAAAAIAATPANTSCTTPEYHQLDFWIGQWTVYEKDSGKKAAVSQVESVAGGCGIAEHYEAQDDTGAAYSRTSYTVYSRDDGKWHRMSVDTNGDVEWLSGKLDDDGLTFEAPGANNTLRKSVLRRIDDGSVEQIGTVGTDYGKHWKPLYDHVYKKK